MSRNKSQWRFFLAYEDPKQEAWLEDQARQGWHLVRPGVFRFSFIQGEPRPERYRLDYQMLRGEKRRDYLQLFQDAGWDFLGAAGNRYYFRARPEAFSPEILSDPDSRRDRIRRELGLLGMLGGILAWNTSLMGTALLRESERLGGFKGWLIPMALLFCVVVAVLALTGWCVWKLARAMGRVE